MRQVKGVKQKRERPSTAREKKTKSFFYINTQFVSGEDILFAMSTLGFDNYVEPLKLYLQKYREAMKGERQMEAELSNLGGEVMAGQQLQALTASEGDVLLTYSNGQQFQL